MKHIAILKLQALGDIVMSTPLLTAIKTKYPDCRITWIANKTWAPALEGHPLIAEVIALPTEHRRKLWRGRNYARWFADTWRLQGELGERRFDAVLNFHPERWWTHPLCVAPRRVGVFPGKVPFWAGAVCTDILRNEHTEHDTKHYLAATRHLGIPDAGYTLTIGAEEDRVLFFRDFVARHAPGHRGPVVVVAPFSTADNKCWDGSRVAALCDRLRTQFGALVIMTMGPGDGEKAREIAEQAAYPPVLAEGTSLPEYIALLRHADLAVTMDSSAMHLCAALGTPFVTLWGPTDETKLRPLVGEGMTLRSPLACAPCHRSTCANPYFRECMDRITVSDVEGAVASSGFLRALPVVQSRR